MANRDWDQMYEANDLPWDTGETEPLLVEEVEAGRLAPGRLFEIGCGTGTNAIWLAQRGFEVHATDLSPRAVELARQKAQAAGVDLELSVVDFLTEEIPASGSFDAVFDRGVFHTFDDPAQRSDFARRVAQLLTSGGRWLCLAGSTEGPPRDHGPPRRSARDLMDAVEPFLEIELLRTAEFDANLPSVPKAWVLLARRRDED